MEAHPDSPPDVLSLPDPATAEGGTRRVGIEIEFGGLTEDLAAEVLANVLGGQVRQSDSFQFVVEDTEIGAIEVYLDTAYRKDGRDLVQTAIETARGVLPVELVTEPILPDQIADLDRACRRLSEAGATGTADGLLLGFGLHLNVAVSSLTTDHLTPVLRTYALCEDVLRDGKSLDLARRVQPFIQPYPRGLVDALAAHPPTSRRDWVATYLDQTTSRNHGLDALPIIREIDEAAVLARVDNHSAVSARPAWHYRLPDSRPGEPGWSVAREWRVWVALEQIANDPVLLDRLSAAWLDYHDSYTTTPSDWRAATRDVLAHTLLIEEVCE